ncbi:hypothetical protein GGI17_005313 [Coemansia sp. S146]|nr:hypothetical protein GGI17_005313 [Coemansia sp. S146]
MGKTKRHSGHSASHPSHPSNDHSATAASTLAAPVPARASAKDKGKAPDTSDVDLLDEPLDSVEAEIVTTAAKGARAMHGIVKAEKNSPPGLDKPAAIDGRWWKQYFATRPMHLRPLVVDPEIFDEINRIVKYMGPLRAEVTEFLSFHFKRCIEAYGELPIINETTVRHAIYFVRDRGKCKYGETDGMRRSYNERGEGGEFPQPKASQRTNKRMKQWRKSKHRKVRAVTVVVADATPHNARATPIIDTCFAADINDYSDADGDACSDTGDSWTDCSSYADTDCGAYIDADSDTWSDCDAYADADAGDEQVDSAATVAVVDRKKTHKRGKDYNPTRMARICRKKNKRENKEKLERRLGIHHSQRVPPAEATAVGVQSQHTPHTPHTGRRARHKHRGNNVTHIPVDPAVEELHLEIECLGAELDQEMAVARSGKLAR